MYMNVFLLIFVSAAIRQTHPRPDSCVYEFPSNYATSLTRHFASGDRKYSLPAVLTVAVVHWLPKIQ